MLIVDNNIDGLFEISEWLYRIFKRPIIFECTRSDEVAEFIDESRFEIVICNCTEFKKNKDSFLEMSKRNDKPFFIFYGNESSSLDNRCIVDSKSVKINDLNFLNLRDIILKQCTILSNVK